MFLLKQLDIEQRSAPSTTDNTCPCVSTPLASGTELHRPGLPVQLDRADCPLANTPSCPGRICKLWSRSVTGQHHLLRTPTRVCLYSHEMSQVCQIASQSAEFPDTPTSCDRRVPLTGGTWRGLLLHPVVRCDQEDWRDATHSEPLLILQAHPWVRM